MMVGWGGLEQAKFGTVAQQKCAKLCHGILKSAAIFLGVSVSALGMHIPLVHAQVALGSIGRLVGAAAVCL